MLAVGFLVMVIDGVAQQEGGEDGDNDEKAYPVFCFHGVLLLVDCCFIWVNAEGDGTLSSERGCVKTG